MFLQKETFLTSLLMPDRHGYYLLAKDLNPVDYDLSLKANPQPFKRREINRFRTHSRYSVLSGAPYIPTSDIGLIDFNSTCKQGVMFRD